MGVISMKLCGEGQFTRAEDRDTAMKFAMNLGCVDCVTIGFKSTAEIDEAVDRIARVLTAEGACIGAMGKKHSAAIVRHQFDTALNALIEQLKLDRSVLTPLLCGSLTH